MADSGSYYVDIQNALDDAAAIAARHELHGNKVQAYAAGKLARVYVTIKRYKPKARLYYETNIDGRPVYMGEKAHAIFAASLVEIEAGRELHTRQLANVTGASQGYVTKVLQFLCRFNFYEFVSVRRGRYGGILLKLAKRIRQSFLHSAKGSSIYGGMIKAVRDANIAENDRREAWIAAKAKELLAAGTLPSWYVP